MSAERTFFILCVCAVLCVSRLRAPRVLLLCYVHIRFVPVMRRQEQI